MKKTILILLVLIAIRINAQPVKVQTGIYGGFSSFAGIEAGLKFDNKFSVNLFTELNLKNFDPVNVTGLGLYTNFNTNQKNSGLVVRAGIGDKKYFYSCGYYYQIELKYFYIRPQIELNFFRSFGINSLIAVGLLL